MEFLSWMRTSSVFQARMNESSLFSDKLYALIIKHTNTCFNCKSSGLIMHLVYKLPLVHMAYHRYPDIDETNYYLYHGYVLHLMDLITLQHFMGAVTREEIV